MNLFSIKKYTTLITMILSITIIVACAGTEENTDGPTTTSILLNSSPDANHVGIFLAQEKGYFTEENITVTINTTPTGQSEIINSVINGTNDFAIIGQLDLLKAIDDGKQIKGITAINQNSLHALVSLKDSSKIESPKDLIGKQVGYPGTIYSEKLLETMLITEGVQLNEVNLINNGEEVDSALINGEVDVIVTENWPKLKSKLNIAGKEHTIIQFTGWAVPEYYELVLITTKETTEKKENFTKRFVKALRRGYEDSINDTGSAVQAMINQNSNIEFDANLENEYAKTLIETWKPFRPVRGARIPLYGDQDANIYQVLIRWMRKHQLVGSTVNYADAYLNKFNLNE